MVLGRIRKNRRKSKKRNNVSKPLIKNEVLTEQSYDEIPEILSCSNDLYLNEYFKLNDEEIWFEKNNIKKNEIDTFVYQFAIFQSDNNIGMISDTMNSRDWIEVDSFIFKYLYKLACENKIKTIICDYGISNGFIRLCNFYKEDLCIGFLQSDSEILDYISKQSDSSINSDIALAILREAIGFTSLNRLIY